MPLPELTDSGDLPAGVYRATLQEVRDRFGVATPRRKVVVLRLERICQLAIGTGHLARLVVFGSFVTAKPEPNDVDVFLMMDDSFDVGQFAGEVRLLFDHSAAQTHFGASVFWMRRLAALGGEQKSVEFWQTKRDGNLRGIIEITQEPS